MSDTVMANKFENELDRAERWAKRDAQRTKEQAYYAQQAEDDRQAHIAIVAEALAEAWHESLDWVRPDAVIAVDALLAHGVVFTRFGTNATNGDIDD